MSYSVFFNALALLQPDIATAEKWHIGTKTSNTFDNYLSMELVFRYYDNPSQFNITGKRMTLFQQGENDVVGTGIAVILKKEVNLTDPIQIGLLASVGTGGSQTNWTEVPGSFVSLNSIGDISVDAFYVLMTYDITGSNTILTFYVTEYDTIIKTAPDFSFTTTITDKPANVNHWAFGSAPEAITDSNGYLTGDHQYNSYVAQNTEVSFLRTWNVLIPATSSIAGEYVMFNSVDSTHSLYNLNKLHTQLPANTSGLEFQLQLTGTTIPTNMLNSAVNPSQVVTATDSVQNWDTLNPPSQWHFNVNHLSEPVNSYTFIQNSNIPCLLKGTKILTESGYKLIEDLTLEDILITIDNKKTHIVEIFKNYIYATDRYEPYVIRKGQYNAFEDLYISPKHSILINNERFIQTYKLRLEKSGIKDQVITYYHIKTNNFFKDVIVANGVAVETYIPILTGKEVPVEYHDKDGNRLLL